MKIPSLEHGENMLCTDIVFDIQNNLCTQHVLPICSTKIGACDKDLPVCIIKKNLMSVFQTFQIVPVPDLGVIFITRFPYI